MSKTKRISMTIPTSLIKDLDFVSRHLSVSRSSLISEILETHIGPVKSLLEQCIPPGLDSDNEPLSRNPEKVRSFLDSLQASLTEERQNFDKLLEGSKNEH